MAAESLSRYQRLPYEFQRLVANDSLNTEMQQKSDADHEPSPPNNDQLITIFSGSLHQNLASLQQSCEKVLQCITDQIHNLKEEEGILKNCPSASLLDRIFKQDRYQLQQDQRIFFIQGKIEEFGKFFQAYQRITPAFMKQLDDLPSILGIRKFKRLVLLLGINNEMTERTIKDEKIQKLRDELSNVMKTEYEPLGKSCSRIMTVISKIKKAIKERASHMTSICHLLNHLSKEVISTDQQRNENNSKWKLVKNKFPYLFQALEESLVQEEPPLDPIAIEIPSTIETELPPVFDSITNRLLEIQKQISSLWIQTSAAQEQGCGYAVYDRVTRTHVDLGEADFS